MELLHISIETLPPFPLDFEYIIKFFPRFQGIVHMFEERIKENTDS